MMYNSNGCNGCGNYHCSDEPMHAGYQHAAEAAGYSSDQKDLYGSRDEDAAPLEESEFDHLVEEEAAKKPYEKASSSHSHAPEPGSKNFFMNEELIHHQEEKHKAVPSKEPEKSIEETINEAIDNVRSS